MDLYQTYRKDLQDVHKVLGESFAEVAKSLDTSNGGAPAAPMTHAARQAKLQSIAELIQQGKTCLSHMEMEANDLIPAERITVRAELVEQKKKLSKYDGELVQLKQKAQAAEREELLRGSGGPAGRRSAAEDANAANLAIPDDLDEQSKKERRAIAAATDKQKGNTDIMLNIERIAVNSNAMLKDAHGNLLKQRETLTEIDEKTRELDADVSDARRIANQMHKVMVQNKAILLGIIGLLSIMIILILYVKTVGSGTTTESTVVVVLPTSPAGGSGSDGGSSGGLDM